MRCDMMVGGTDKGYIRALVQYLMVSNLNQFNIRVVDTSEGLADGLSSTNFSIYLVEESLLLPLLEGLPQEALVHIVVLTEALTKIDTHALQVLLKYQKASTIEQVLLDNFRQFTSSELVTEAGTKGKIIGFYSPVGGVGTTTMAQVFAQIKSSKGYKVLFISLESYPSYDLLYHSGQLHNMSDYMVHLLGNDNWLLGLEAMISIDVSTGIHYFKAVNHSQDLAEFQVGLWPEWCAYIAKNGDFDYLVIDVGKDLYKDGMALLELCHHRIFLSNNSRLAGHKWSRFSKALAGIHKSSLLNNKTLICNASRKSQQSEEAFDGLFQYDPLLIKTSKEGEETINPHSTVYRQMEGMITYV